MQPWEAASLNDQSISSLEAVLEYAGDIMEKKSDLGTGMHFISVSFFSILVSI